jgi:hypothetical protein
VATKLLQGLRRQKGHEFWADDYSFVDGTIDLSRFAFTTRSLTLQELMVEAPKANELEIE